jgi:hypothetical protein
MRKYRKASRPGFKICNRCNRELEATPDVFLRDKTRCDGLAYECRVCHRARKLGRDNRTDRWANMTSSQRVVARARNRRYFRTDKGRAVSLRQAYQRIDCCDMTTAEVLDLIKKPCFHCGTTISPRGLDRIDNDLPHIKGNVVPSCAPCNFARGNRFTFEEMKLIGVVIRQVLEARLTDKSSKKVESEDRP